MRRSGWWVVTSKWKRHHCPRRALPSRARPPKQAAELFEPLNTTDIKIPVLFVCGEEESGGGMVDMFKQTATQCAGFCEVVVVREAGHFVHLEKPNGFLHKLIPFLEMGAVSEGKQVKIKYVQETAAPILEPKKI